MRMQTIFTSWAYAKNQSLILVDYLWDKCTSAETAYDVTERVMPAAGAGKCWLVPASLDTQSISRLLDEGYDIERLNSHVDSLIADLEIDFLLIDTHPGLNDESMAKGCSWLLP